MCATENFVILKRLFYINIHSSAKKTKHIFVSVSHNNISLSLF